MGFGILALIVGLIVLTNAILGNDIHASSSGEKTAAKQGSYGFAFLVIAAIIICVAH